MATTITSYTNIKGGSTRIIRGTVGTAIALVAVIYEPTVRVSILNQDATAANVFDIFVARHDPAATREGGTDGTVGQGAQIKGSQERVMYFHAGDVITAKAAADREVEFVIQVEGAPA